MGPYKFVGLCFLIFAAFGAGYYYKDIAGVEPFLAYAEAPAAEQDCAVPKTVSGSPQEYCAILTMPRSFIPFLERLKSNKLAKDVTITTARIENNNGRLTAVAEEAGEAEKFAGPAPENPSEVKDTSEDKPDNSVLGALAVYFLAGVKHQQTH